ncbi:O-antigen ligase family protein [Pseudonocardia halophobica]|uniref:O-antigen ligase family protein n=1 Tax=Pseudonocardia halophobica TaxID=29401 RepID=UPI003D917436
MTPQFDGMAAWAPARPHSGAGALVAPAVVGGAVLVVAGLAGFVAPAHAGAMVLLGGVGAAVAAIGLGSPVVAVTVLLVAQAVRLALPEGPPSSIFLVAFVGVIASATLAVARRAVPTPRPDGIELAMVLYALWNVGSAFADHAYAATIPLTGQTTSVYRFLLGGTIIPFVLFFVGRHVVVRTSVVRLFLWFSVGLSAYSAMMAFFQFNGPASLIWPRFIAQSEVWPGRAVGIFNQPVMNGLTFTTGFAAAVALASLPGRLALRVVAGLVAIASVYGVFATHTRGTWLAFAAVLVLGALFARGMRFGYLATLGAICLVIATNWQTFTSADRAEGGVGSAGEVEDRLNSAATSLWAIEQKPLFGWGIARFVPVNTYHHQQWSPDVPWERGFAIASHLNELGIAAELGLIGLALWLVVQVLLAANLVKAWRRTPSEDRWGSALVFVAGGSWLALVISGFTADLRFFDYSNSMIMLLVGMAIGWAAHRSKDAGTHAPAAATPRPAPTAARTAGVVG